jgi:hypothetical protein
MRHEAIRKLYPQVVIIQDGIGCFDSSGQLVEIDEVAVTAENIRLEKTADLYSYRGKRAQEYPNLTDLADAVYWQANGDSTKMQEYLASVAAVKEKYPKPASFNIDTVMDSVESGTPVIGQAVDTIGSIADSITGAQ